MEKFSLDKYLENPSRKVVTRDGRSVRIICTDYQNAYKSSRKIIALVQEKGFDNEILHYYNEHGIEYLSDGDRDIDLFFTDEENVKIVRLSIQHDFNMAAIDKLYVRTYEDYDDLRRWALIYYPKLLIYFYNIDLRREDFNKHGQPITNTTFKVDRKLKWICPLYCVREYLHNQCGVNPKWEWLYRIFWRGKKYFI